jgi:hypothetical protein
MTSIPDLIAQWRAKTLSGASLMRGLVSWNAWEVPVSEAAVKVALTEQALPSIQLSTARDGKACLLIFSTEAAYEVYRKANNVAVAQHFVSMPGRTLFGVPLDGVDQLWIDPLCPHDIYYDTGQLGRLRECAAALAVETALAGLRQGEAPDGALKLVRNHPAYFIAVAQIDGVPRMLLAPDAKGRMLGAIFTTDDAYDAFLPHAKAQAGAADVQRLQMSGVALFAALARMQLDGIVFNCDGPVAPVAFAHAMAKVVLDG